jgi:virulence-associated protein VagC
MRRKALEPMIRIGHVPYGTPIWYGQFMSIADHDSDTRTASLFRNASNLAVRIPTDWIDPDGDIRKIEMVRHGDTIVLRPVRDQSFAELLDELARTPVPQTELDTWAEPESQTAGPVEL